MSQLAQSILDGVYDEELQSIRSACNSRHQILHPRARKDAMPVPLKVGDRVKFGPGVNPSYLSGVVGTVVLAAHTNVSVRVDRNQAVGLLNGGIPLACPSYLLRPVEE